MSKMSIDQLYKLNTELVNMLLAMDYSQEFSAQFKCPPISRYYFCRESNQAQQFFSFCCLSAYILSKLNTKSNFRVDIFDDPSITIDKIVTAATKYLNDDRPNEDKTKFRFGYGLEVLTFLNDIVKVFMANNENIEQRKHSIKFIRQAGTNDEEDDEEDDEMEDENEIELEEEMDDYIIAEEESSFMDMWDEQTSESMEAVKLEQDMIISNTNALEWKLELERVSPQLTARSLSKMLRKSGASESEWRLHYDTMLSQRHNIEQVDKQVKSHLTSLVTDLVWTIEKIASKDNYLHQSLNIILAEWASVRAEVVQARKLYEAVDLETKDKSQRLQELNDECRSIKQQVEEYSFRMTDNSPLLEAKRGRDILRQELVKINLQIGVALQTLVRHASIYTSAFY